MAVHLNNKERRLMVLAVMYYIDAIQDPLSRHLDVISTIEHVASEAQVPLSDWDMDHLVKELKEYFEV